MLGDRLSAMRAKNRWTQQDVANKVGISRGTYAHYEINKREPDNATLIKLATLFEVSLDYLLGRTDKSNEQVRTEPTLSGDLSYLFDVDTELRKSPRSFLVYLPNNKERAEVLQRIVSEFGRILRTLRLDSGLTPDELSQKTSVPWLAIIRYESPGALYLPDRRHVETLTKFFRVSVDYVFGMSKVKSAEKWVHYFHSSIIYMLDNSDVPNEKIIESIGLDINELVDKDKSWQVTNDAQVLFKLSGVLWLPIKDLFEAASYSCFDYDQYDPQTGERITEPSLSEEDHILKELSNDPETMLMFSDYASASLEDKRMLLEIWRSIKKNRKGEQIDGGEIEKDKQ